LYSKQFLVLQGNQSLFQQATRRLASLAAKDIAVGAPCIVGNEEHRFLVLDQLRELKLPVGGIILEPAGRNTAPAVALAAHHLADKHGRDTLMLVLAADHLIGDALAFNAAVGDAAALACEGHLVTFGIVPTAPETGFGYIECGAPLGSAPSPLAGEGRGEGKRAAERQPFFMSVCIPDALSSGQQGGNTPWHSASRKTPLVRLKFLPTTFGARKPNAPCISFPSA
jgi:hypothetical protein